MSAVEGVIIPPPDIKGVVDKTATFVAKHGAQFEDKIKATQGGAPKFAFLQDDNIYNAYYKQKIEDVKNGVEEGVFVFVSVSVCGCFTPLLSYPLFSYPLIFLLPCSLFTSLLFSLHLRVLAFLTSHCVIIV